MELDNMESIQLPTLEQQERIALIRWVCSITKLDPSAYENYTMEQLYDILVEENAIPSRRPTKKADNVA